ncbi:class I SAM-dependent methyltransferase [Chamaesiphon minutus]|uniref:2-polyprenyl-3-methyl-5-hydroxy-6-metoxy-1, 4-benzoquinol methylase n=1 Tax=Chamaesiphon minutus (strain ATCC 27169 / PCC 6605) TaxID=1173020 RepID=K9UJ21_CHAP6|nr:class I SAM-dependent methyltransferase [Chamaesiphon minutus]AFY94663.1 2-polyprenyl-3-methyl-5-hydroxy-6-metoxy-1,4-benzoquinol methylase [Chamaesiphon minutus PCC 6605]
MSDNHCRFCEHPLQHTFVNLGGSPISNDFLNSEQVDKSEKFYPLHTYVCDRCFLVQLPEVESREHIFGDGNYAYFSSYSESWLKHCQRYTNLMVERFGFDRSSQVIEIASNDGYLLQYFQAQNIPVLGIEPASNVAAVAEAKGIPTLTKFFGVQTATELVELNKQADLLLGNNVLAHVPDLNDFVAGMKLLLKPAGVITIEFPHLLQLITQNQFDTIYHEHFSYFSFLTVERVFAAHGLTLFDVEELPTHGGSLRIYGRHSEYTELAITDRVAELKAKEVAAKLDTIDTYLDFTKQVESIKRQLLTFLIQAKNEGKSVVGYGAPAKGNTLLNYCGVRTDFIDYTVDRSPHKQGLFLPGTHIPVYHPDLITETKPDYLLILPWNLRSEVIEQMAQIRDWRGKFVVPIPRLEIL